MAGEGEQGAEDAARGPRWQEREQFRARERLDVDLMLRPRVSGADRGCSGAAEITTLPRPRRDALEPATAALLLLLP
jgi:hypothetical protein